MKRTDKIINQTLGSQLYGFKSEAEKKQEERDEVHKKYNIGAYMTPYSFQNRTYEEAVNIEPNYYQKVTNMVKSHITNVLKKDYAYYDTLELHQKILKDKKLHGEKESKFLSHVKTYIEKLNNFSSKLNNSTTLVEADGSYQQMVSFHDTDLNIINNEQSLALEDFQVKMVGEYSDL